MFILLFNASVEAHDHAERELGRDHVLLHAYNLTEALRVLDICTSSIGCVLYSGKEEYQIHKIKAKLVEKLNQPRYAVYSNYSLPKLAHQLKSN